MIAAGTAALIGAGITAAANTGSSIYSTERNLWHASDEAQKQRDFEREMANTQYQRAIVDMEAAGLNPAAIGQGMSSNSVPSSAAAIGNYGHAVDFSNIFSSAVSAAMARDKNVANKVLQEMKDETALQVQGLRSQGRIENEIQKKALGHSAYRVSNQPKQILAKLIGKIYR